MKQLFYPIWKNKNLKIVLPLTPVLSPTEGIHFLIFHKTIQAPFWKINTLTPIIECSNLALNLAWMITKNGFIPDFWANIQWNAHHPFNRGVNILGRNPLSRTWGEPVNFPKKLPEVKYSQEWLLKLKKTCNKYINFWKKSLPCFLLFSGGIKNSPQGSQEFLEAEKIFNFNKTPKKKKDVLWVNEKFILTIPRMPHLTGFHFQIFPYLKYWNKIGGFRSPWQLPKDINSTQSHFQIQGFLEMTAILFGVIKILLKERGLNFYNPEIHFSGNWNKDLLLKEKGGKLSLDFNKNIKKKNVVQQIKIIEKEKKKYAINGPDEFRTVGHGHLYATFSPKKFVKLPRRPIEIMPSEWKKIISLRRKKINLLRKLLQKNLTCWLKNNSNS